MARKYAHRSGKKFISWLLQQQRQGRKAAQHFWILTGGFWKDSGFWDDSKVWED